jgi:hypothetical protein
LANFQQLKALKSSAQCAQFKRGSAEFDLPAIDIRIRKMSFCRIKPRGRERNSVEKRYRILESLCPKVANLGPRDQNRHAQLKYSQDLLGFRKHCSFLVDFAIAVNGAGLFEIHIVTVPFWSVICRSLYRSG